MNVVAVWSGLLRCGFDDVTTKYINWRGGGCRVFVTTPRGPCAGPDGTLVIALTMRCFLAHYLRYGSPSARGGAAAVLTAAVVDSMVWCHLASWRPPGVGRGGNRPVPGAVGLLRSASSRAWSPLLKSILHTDLTRNPPGSPRRTDRDVAPGRPAWPAIVPHSRGCGLSSRPSTVFFGRAEEKKSCRVLRFRRERSQGRCAAGSVGRPVRKSHWCGPD